MMQASKHTLIQVTLNILYVYITSECRKEFNSKKCQSDVIKGNLSPNCTLVAESFDFMTNFNKKLIVEE